MGLFLCRQQASRYAKASCAKNVHSPSKSRRAFLFFGNGSVRAARGRVERLCFSRGNSRVKLRDDGVQPRPLKLRSVVVHPPSNPRSIKCPPPSSKMKPKAAFPLGFQGCLCLCRTPSFTSASMTDSFFPQPREVLVEGEPNLTAESWRKRTV